MPIVVYPGEPFPVATAADVAALVGRLGAAAGDERRRNTLGDHFAYVAAVCPQWFRPHQEAVVREALDGFALGVSFDVMCVLLQGAPDVCVGVLERRLKAGWSFTAGWALAAIGTPAALEAIGGLVRGGADRAFFAECGVWTPASGPAEYRFSVDRLVIERRDADGVAEHPVGLPLEAFVGDPGTTKTVWHYLSLRPDAVPGLPPWPAGLVHLASPLGSVGWTLTAGIDDSGRWVGESVAYDEPEDLGEEDEPHNDQGPKAAVVLRPFDADLVYSNGHIESTPGVFGTAGGPPIGLYPNPDCRDCGRLMFHVATVRGDIREYGDGFRSVFVCADCRLTTCSATGWN